MEQRFPGSQSCIMDGWQYATKHGLPPTCQAKDPRQLTCGITCIQLRISHHFCHHVSHGCTHVAEAVQK
jgi:hypothetical protein